jgi:hypothetical protein
MHDDSVAAASADAVDADMYTSGTHIVAGDSYTGPGTAHGRQTLTHELYHVMQQSQGPVAGRPSGDGLTISDPADRHEQAAHRAAEQAAHQPRAATRLGRAVPKVSQRRAALTVQRAKKKEKKNYPEKSKAEAGSLGIKEIGIKKSGTQSVRTSIDVEDLLKNAGVDFSIMSKDTSKKIKDNVKKLIKEDRGEEAKDYLHTVAEAQFNDRNDEDIAQIPVTEETQEESETEEMEEEDQRTKREQDYSKPEKMEEEEEEEKEAPKKKVGSQSRKASDPKKVADAKKAALDILGWLKEAFKLERNPPNWSAGWDNDGNIYLSKVGGTPPADLVRNEIVDRIEQNNYNINHTIFLAKKFGKADGSGYHAEMCIVAAAEAKGKKLVGVKCISRICAFCHAILTNTMSKENIGAFHDDPNQGTWVHPLLPISVGHTKGDQEVQLKLVKALNKKSLEKLDKKQAREDFDRINKDYATASVNWGTTWPRGDSAEMDPAAMRKRTKELDSRPTAPRKVRDQRR